MILKSLEIQGFKSFPDKTRLTFGAGITAVVGPNGSGKSNISDAIRWVLGEQSSRALRGGRMEDVIFGGSVTRRPQGFAEVSLTIDNTARSLGVEADEVTVTRRYYRSGESDYLLNGTEVRLRDINEVFMDTGLGRDGYSIIGQGRIDDIVAAKSEDRREIFEEAAGISKFRYRKEESERRLAAAEDNLLRLKDILAELEARVGPLKEQAEKAKRYVALADEKKTLEIGLWIVALDRQNALLRENENRLALIRAQHDEVERKIAAAEKQAEEIWFESQKKAAQAEDVRREAQSFEEEAVKRDAAVQILQNDIAHQDENIARIDAEAEAFNRSREQADAELSEKQAALAQKRAALDGLNEALDASAAALDELLRQSEKYSAELSGAGERLSAQTQAAQAAAMERRGIEAGRAQAGERLAAIETEHKTRAERLAAAEAQREANTAALDAAAQKLDGLKNALSGYALKLQNRTQKLRQAEQETRALSLQVSEKTQRAGMLRDLEKHLEGFANSVRVVMREKDRGALRGIHGPVSRLIRAPQEYSVAVETALGGALQNIVVDREEDAKAAIRLLKQGNGGRATFLPLSTIRGSAATGNFAHTEGFIGVASALISYDPIYQGVVESLLGRTLVARDLDCAVTLARAQGYRLRVVTLDGQLVNAGGSLTGGSLNRNAGLLSRAAEIERLDAEAAALKEKVGHSETARKAMAEETAALEASVTGVRAEAATVQEEKIRLEADGTRLRETAATLQSELAALEAEKQSLAERDRGAQERLAAADAARNAAEQEIAGIRAQMEQLGGGRDALAKRREEAAEELTGLRMDRMAAQKDAEQLEAGIAALEAANADSRARREAFAAERAACEGKIAVARESITQTKADAAALREKAAGGAQRIEALGAERQALEQRTVALRAEAKSLGEDKEKIAREAARLEERGTTAQAEYDGIVAKLWDEYSLTRSEAEKAAPPVGDPPAAQRRLNALKSQIKALGTVNVAAIDEYREVSERYEFLGGQVADVEKSRAELRALIVGLTAKMREIFSEQFALINRHFSETFTELFGGGTAGLKLTDPSDVLASGIEIDVQPPGKIVHSLQALSGGEQAFVAIALFFAILKVHPAPFCVLDEIEAALDDANVGRFAAYLRRMCGSTQFIVITHRRGTMDEADVLYGVTMQEEGVTKLLTLNVAELVKELHIG